MHLGTPTKLSLCSIQPQLWVPHPHLQLGVRLPCHCSGVCTQITRNNFICMFYLIFHATLISKLNWQLSFMCVSYGYLLSSSPAGPPASWHLAARPPPPPKHFPSRLRLLPLAIPSCHTISVVWTPAAPGPGRAPPPAQRKSPLAHPKNSPRVSNDVPPPTFALSQQFHLPWLLFFLSALSLSLSLSSYLPLTHAVTRNFMPASLHPAPRVPSRSSAGLDRHWA